MFEVTVSILNNLFVIITDEDLGQNEQWLYLIRLYFDHSRRV